MTYLKWALIALVAWYGFKWLTAAYSSGSANLTSDGEAVLGRGLAPDVSVARNDVRAWAPPYGIAHEGAVG